MINELEMDINGNHYLKNRLVSHAWFAICINADENARRDGGRYAICHCWMSID